MKFLHSKKEGERGVVGQKNVGGRGERQAVLGRTLTEEFGERLSKDQKKGPAIEGNLVLGDFEFLGEGGKLPFQRVICKKKGTRTNQVAQYDWVSKKGEVGGGEW